MPVKKCSGEGFEAGNQDYSEFISLAKEKKSFMVRKTFSLAMRQGFSISFCPQKFISRAMRKINKYKKE